ncbi:MAG TPA: hypothetical protein VNR00_05365 [Opitutus sp.]|nr:hypothetical protein [Opitutus sp.]
MTDDFENDALQYLLNEMDATRREAFEQQLARDPQARRALQACADSVAQFAGEAAPPEPMSAFDQRTALAAIVAATKAPETVRSFPAGSKVLQWSHYIWPMAAAVLLALNLLDFKRPLQPAIGPQDTASSGTADRTPARTEPPAAESLARSSPADLAVEAEPFPPAESRSSATRLADGQSAPRATTPTVTDRMQRDYAALRRDYAGLEHEHAELRAKYDTIIRQLADRAVIERNVGRLAAMELVDAASYASGVRRGLVDVARGILTEPGVVVAMLNLPPNAGGGSDPGSTGFVPGGASGSGDSLQPATNVPYAWSVFDDKDHRGYLNVYNLPRPAADQTMQLWVKSADATGYYRVGEVPAQLQGGSGNFYYSLPEASQPPAEILITQEPRTAIPVAPSGPVVLRGP